MDHLQLTDLPPEAGTYVLWIDLRQPLQVSVGRRGEHVLPSGVIAYVGSARGPGGLRARLGRHLRAEKKPHWHIDALTTRVPVVAIWLVRAPDQLECTWARNLIGLPGSQIPVVGFGASDCDCPAHLLAVDPDQLAAAWDKLGQPDVFTQDERFTFSA